MKAQLNSTIIETIRSAARRLKGISRRAFQSETCQDYCKGSARIAERTFGWSRLAVQKGLEELKNNTIIVDKKRSGRPSYSVKLPNLQDDIRSLVDPNSCTHPTFQNTFRYTRIASNVYGLEKEYHRGVALTKSEMKLYGKRLIRTVGIEKWSLTIKPYTTGIKYLSKSLTA